MLRVVLLAGTDECAEAVTRAVKLLGPKVIGYNPVEGWLLVPKIEAQAVVKALELHGLPSEIRTIPSPS